MRFRLLTALVGLAALGSFGATVSGCAEERPAINRVQSMALAKSFFIGDDLTAPSDDPEFYWRNYVVDGSASQSLVGIGSWGGVDRIRWEISEDRLIARKAYQISEGADDKGIPGGDPNGTIVASFAIESHFDIKRAYNQTTGELMNVIEENTIDRPWDQRRYMRVDFSENLVENPTWDDMFVGKLVGNIEVSPATYTITDPASPDAPHWEPEDGYFDVTSRYYIEPQESGLVPGLPTCHLIGFFTGSATYDCNVQEATVRSSFLRVDPEHDFERLEITKAPGDIVGNPAQLSLGGLFVGLAPPGDQGWDPQYGFTDPLYHRFAHIHNVWKQSHIDATCESNVDTDADGTADACHPNVTGYQGSLGSQCDTFENRCTMPYRDREIRTVGYWLNDQTPDFLQDVVDEAGNVVTGGATEDVIASWNQLMANAVARAREVECRRTGGTREACEAQLFNPEKEMLSYGAWLVSKPLDETPVLTLCHNPVREYDNEICGEVGSSARLGDIRKNFLAYWPHASRAPWGGIGNWGSDPLTGEIRGGAAMVMGRSVTHAAAWQRDVIQLALGDITIEDITDGVPAEQYAKMLQNGATPQALSEAELQKRAHSVDASHAEQSVLPAPIHGANIADQYASFVEMEKGTTHDLQLLDNAQLELEALATPLKDSVFEAQLIDGQWLSSVAGLHPDTSTDATIMDQVSPLRSMDPGALRNLRAGMQNILHAKGICFHHGAPAFGSSDLQGLARYFKEKYPDGAYDAKTRGEAIYEDLVRETYKGIAVHEVGHSLGLLHNFASSYDAMNYKPQYWQLRTHEGASTASCNGQPRTGDVNSAASDSCMGPRYLDPETDDELGLAEESRPSLTYYAQSSVMEYPLERFGETSGLGPYDAHAMKALYGRVLETMETEERGGMPIQDQMNFAPRLESQLTEQDRVVRVDGPFAGQVFAKPTHYTELGRRMKVFDPAHCREATEAEKAAGAWRIVHGKVCSLPPRDHAAWGDFIDTEAQPGLEFSLAPAVRTSDTAKTGPGQVRWFYRYGATNNSYFHTQLSDAGADPYEVTVNTIRKFDMNYPWTYFRRKNKEFFYEMLPFAASQRYFERLRAYHWNAANRNAFFRSFGQAAFDEIAGSDDWHRPTVVAETEMFNALARSILAPEPGQFGPMPEQPVDSTQLIFDAGANVDDFGSFPVEIGLARFIGQEFNSDPDAGGSWNYLHWMKHAGFGVEKTFATMALADGRPVLSTINRQNYLDGRDVRINFRSDLPEAVDRLIGGVLAEDWEAVGMSINPQGGVPTMLDLMNVDGAPTREGSQRILFPNVGYRQQLGMLIFAHLYSRQNTDLALSNKLRVWVQGANEAIDVPEVQQIRFYDPESGYTYVARRYGLEEIDGKMVEKGIASRMVEHANALLAASYQVEKTPIGDIATNEFGQPTLVLDDLGHPIPLADDLSRKGELNKYIGLVDAARQIGAILAQGPLGGP